MARTVEAITGGQIVFTDPPEGTTLFAFGSQWDPGWAVLPPPPGPRLVVWSTVWSLFWKVLAAVAALAVALLAAL